MAKKQKDLDQALENKNTKTVKTKEKKKNKDELMNTPIELNDGISIMPHDDETLRTFNLSKMNFKDMTNSQKNTMVMLFIGVLLIFASTLMPTISRIFGGINIGNLRFVNTQKEETPEEKSDFAHAGDFIILGNNTSINISGIKFYNFTKGNNYQLIYNYNSSKDIDDVKELKIYIEIYNYSKTLLTRYAFETDDNTIKVSQVGTKAYSLSTNSFNKAHYIRIRIISDVTQEELPEEDPSNSGSGNGNGGNQGGSGGSGTTTDPTNPGENPSTPVDKNKTLTCSKSNIDGSLKINESLVAKLENDEVKTYHVEYRITSLIDEIPKNYSTYYKAMMKKYKELMESVIVGAFIHDEGLTAYLTYDIDVEKYQNIEIDPEKQYDPADLEYYQSIKHPYDLEIQKKSSRESAKEQLQAVEWTCD